MSLRNLTVAALALLFTSCDKYVPVVANSINLVKQSVDIRNGLATINNYTYDQAGRALTIASPSDTAFYEYTSYGYIMKNKAGRTEAHIGPFFGYLDSVITPFGSDKYSYDKDWNLASIYHYDKSEKLVGTETFKWDNNRNKVLEDNGKIKISYTYTNLPNTLDGGFKYFRKNRHLVATSTYSGSINRSFSHTYEFDELGRLTKETVKENDNDFFNKKL